MKKSIFVISILGFLLFTTSIGNASFVKSKDNMDLVVIEIKKGWNLVPTYMSADDTSLLEFAVSKDTKVEDIYLVNGNLYPKPLFRFDSPGSVDSLELKIFTGGPYFLDPINKNFVLWTDFWGGWKEFTNKEKSLDEEFRNKVRADSDLTENVYMSGLWIYSIEDLKLIAKDIKILERINQQPSGVKLYKGWNFFSITPDLGTGKLLSDIKGSCEVSRTFVWDNLQQSWTKLNPDQIYMESEDVGAVLAVKVADDCKLYSESIVPPPIPT